MSAVNVFNTFLLQISNELRDDNLKNLKFLCSDKIGKKRLERVQSGIDLFQCLKELNEIGPDNTVKLTQLLREIKRQDLADKVLEQQPYVVASQNTKEEEKLSKASEAIADNLGRDWKRFGRKLGLKEAGLDQIQRKHPDDLREQVLEVIRVWRGARKDATAIDLVEALRSCKLNYTADIVEKEIAE